MIHNISSRKNFPWSIGTRVRVIRLIRDPVYQIYADDLAGKEGTVSDVWGSEMQLEMDDVFQDTGSQYFTLDLVELVRLDDPDENY